jgi:pilus assembly protein Flp/PilA
MRGTFSRLRRAEDGATSIEYALIASLIAVVIVGSIILIGGSVTGMFTNVSAGF